MTLDTYAEPDDLLSEDETVDSEEDTLDKDVLIDEIDFALKAPQDLDIEVMLTHEDSTDETESLS